MKNIKKQILYYTTAFLTAFFLGILFDHYVLCKSIDIEQKPKKELEIVLQKEQEQQTKDRTLSTEQGCTIYVDINGAVRNPGVYCLNMDALVIDAVNKAGGFSKDAGLKFIARKINLAQPLVNNQKLYFPYEKELICELQPLLDESNKVAGMMNPPITNLPTSEPYIDQNTTTTPPNTPDTTTDTGNVQCVNINTATKEQLITLNGVGEVTAEKIIQGRPYSKIEDLLNVSGIGEATLEKFKADICI